MKTLTKTIEGNLEEIKAITLRVRNPAKSLHIGVEARNGKIYVTYLANTSAEIKIAAFAVENPDSECTAILLKDVKKGDFLKRKPDANKVFIKSDYYRPEKSYELTSTEDVLGTGIFLKGTTIVYVGFTY